MTRATLLLALASISLTALAQVTLRKAMLGAPAQWSTPAEIMRSALALALSPYLIAGMALYAMSIVLWLAVLSRTEVSLAYPLASVGFIITAIVAYFTLGESLTPARLFGILLICVGVVLVSRTA
jgi:drug/metabolite transporter (DMT)-like permease